MKFSRDTLRGYILEEVLAYLIRNTGYRLLVDDSQDKQELGWRHNGLVVKGRGAVHQVDVLGELSWIPAFTYPLRLFVEAKFRQNKIGIPEVRNMVATLLDVNQNNLPQLHKAAGNNPQLKPKYYYAGAIFSASGFSEPAMDMALAHNISLIELNTPEFQPLLDGISAAADSIVETLEPPEAEVPAGQVPEDEDESIEKDMLSPDIQAPRGRFLLALRTALRQRFETQTRAARNEALDLADKLTHLLRPAINAATQTGELFVGMGQGPYMLVMKADQPEGFLEYARHHPVHDVTISWSSEIDEGGTWIVSPVHQTENRLPYSLRFRVPQPIYDWIFSADNVPRTALDAKKLYFSSISIFHKDPERDLLIRLEFNPTQILRRRQH